MLRRSHLPLVLAALFALLWAAARACVQSVTMDEADTYLKFVGRAQPFHWFPAANNHMLNSALIRLFTSIFGLSHFTLRLPAMLGAVSYVGGCLYLCVLLSERISLTFPLFLCMVYNPFVFDFLVLARGYGMASGFLVCGVAAVASVAFRNVSPVRGLAACSAFAALSFCSNFSFAFANLTVLAAALWWIVRAHGFSLRLLAAATLPGTLITALIPLPTLIHWPPGQLFEGAVSLRQSLASVMHWSLYELNPEIANPLVYDALHRIAHWLFPALGVAVAWRIAALLMNRNWVATSALVGMAVMLGSVLLVTTAVHWIAFHLFGLLLPYNRTALFYVPMGTLFVGALGAIPSPSRALRASSIACIGMLSLFAAYFLFCMRLSWSGETRADADVRNVYSALAPYNHTYCVGQVGVNWLYSSALDFYRVMSGRESFSEFQPGLPLPEDAAVYVLNAKFDGKFIEQQRLSIVYRGPLADTVIAIRPDRMVRRDPVGNCAP